MLVAGTGAVAENVSFPTLQMTDFEATLIASGATRYAERQPDSIVAQIIDQSDLGAVVVGAGSYTVRNLIALYKAIVQWAQARAEAAAAAAKQAAKEEIG